MIPGGLPAVLPLALHGHGAAGVLPVAGHVWLGRRAWPRWVVAALALGLTGATAVPTAANAVYPHAAVVRIHHRGNAEDEEAALANLLCGRGLTAAGGARAPCAEPGLINQGAPSRTSSVLNPGPRLDAGRTVTVKHAATRARRTDSGSAPNSSSVMP